MKELKIVRGRVYKCSKCDWSGEKYWAPDHFSKKHCTIHDAPFACKICNFKAGSEASLNLHFKKKQHQRRSEGCTDDAKYTLTSKINVMDNFEIWSAEKSKEVWNKKPPTSKNSSDTLEEIRQSGLTEEQLELFNRLQTEITPSTDLLQSAMQIAELPTIVLDEPSENKDQQPEVNDQSNLQIDNETQIENEKPKSPIETIEQKSPKKRAHSSSSTSSSGSSSSSSGSSSSSSSSSSQKSSYKRIRSPTPPKKPIEASPPKKAKLVQHSFPEELPSEEHFRPDYQENEPSDIITNKKLISTIVCETIAAVNENIISTLVERPSTVAIAVHGVTKQLLHTGSQLDSLANKLDGITDRAVNNQKDFHLKSVLSELKTEVKLMNNSMIQHNQSLIQMSSAVKELSSAIKTFHNQQHSLFNAVTTSLETFSSAFLKQQSLPSITTTQKTSTPPLPEVIKPVIDNVKQAREFDDEWEKEKENELEHHEKRRPEYPHPHTPNDKPDNIKPVHFSYPSERKRFVYKNSYKSLYRASTERSHRMHYRY